MRTHAKEPTPAGRAKAAAASPAERAHGAPSPIGNQALQQLLLSGGRSLPASERAFFEPRLGVDLGAVRIHDDPQAAQAASQLEARAFTVGNDIAFGVRQFRPATGEGRKLIAHELAHTLQQTQAPTIQRSAVAHFEPAGFKEQAEVVEDEFEKTLPRKAQRRRFEERLQLLDPEQYEQAKDDLSRTYGSNRKKLARKLKQLDRRRARAARKIGPLPDLGKILVIEVTYHYVARQTRFSPGALAAVKEKFRVGRIWKDIKWNGQTIGVRFAIGFQEHKKFEEVKKISGETPGHARMVGEPLAPPGSRLAEYDYTQEPPVTPPEKSEDVGAGSYQQIAIDTNAIRRENVRIKYYTSESDRAEGGAPSDDLYPPSPSELDAYMASVIAHEIGHNIGMIHDDKDVMRGQKVGVLHVTKSSSDIAAKGGGDTTYSVRVSYPDNPVTLKNIQKLVDRIPDMTKKGRLYWALATGDFDCTTYPEDCRIPLSKPETFIEDPSRDSGTTVLQPP